MYFNISIRDIEESKRLQEFVINTLGGTWRSGKTTIDSIYYSILGYSSTDRHISIGPFLGKRDLIDITADLFIATRGRGSFQIGDYVQDITITGKPISKIVEIGATYLKLDNSHGSLYHLNGTYYQSDTTSRLVIVDTPTTPAVPAPSHHKEAPLKPRLLKPFNKDASLNVRGMFYQLQKYPDIVDTRPFVVAMLAAERALVHASISKMVHGVHPFNIKLSSLAATLRAAAFLDQPADLTPDHIVAYYEYTRLVKATYPSYDWLATHLTHANVTASKPLVLFTSKHRTITLDKGFITLVEDGVSYTTEIQYDSAANTFYFQ